MLKRQIKQAAATHTLASFGLRKLALSPGQIGGLVGAGVGGIGGYLSDPDAKAQDRLLRTLGGAGLGGAAGYGIGHYGFGSPAAKSTGGSGGGGGGGIGGGGGSHAAPAAPAKAVETAEQAAARQQEIARLKAQHAELTAQKTQLEAAAATAGAGGVSAPAPAVQLSTAPSTRASAAAGAPAAAALSSRPQQKGFTPEEIAELRRIREQAAGHFREAKNPTFGSLQEYIEYSGTMPFAKAKAQAAYNHPQVPKDYNSLQMASALQGASPEELQELISSPHAPDWQKSFAQELLAPKGQLSLF